MLLTARRDRGDGRRRVGRALGRRPAPAAHPGRLSLANPGNARDHGRSRRAVRRLPDPLQPDRPGRQPLCAPGPRPAGRRQRSTQVAAGQRSDYYATTRRRPVPRPRVHGRASRTAARSIVARIACRHRQRAPADQALDLADRRHRRSPSPRLWRRSSRRPRSRPVRRLTAAAESVAATGSLTERVDVVGRDELGRLAARFNAMLAALENSVGAQRRLVADASHELRTPLTAARTNVEPDPRGQASRTTRRARARRGLGRARRPDAARLRPRRAGPRRGAPAAVEDVQLDDLVASVVERAQARAPQVSVRDGAVAVDASGRRGAARACGLEPARQRRQVQPRRRADRGERAGRRGGRGRPRPGHRRGGSPRASSTASTGPRRPDRSRGPASGLRSCARPPRRTAAARRARRRARFRLTLPFPRDVRRHAR